MSELYKHIQRISHNLAPHPQDDRLPKPLSIISISCNNLQGQIVILAMQICRSRGDMRVLSLIVDHTVISSGTESHDLNLMGEKLCF